MKRLIFLVLFGILFCTPAFAQSACTYIAPGAVLTAGQWNACFEQKLNVNGSAPGAGGINTQLQYNQNGALSGVGSATYSGDVLTLASPVLITPNLGTPSALTLTNANGLPISTGVGGLGSGVAAALANTAGGSGGFALVSVSQLAITRAQIPSNSIYATTIIVTGFYANGDLGTGSVYTSNGATSGGLEAIQDAKGTWFNLVPPWGQNVGWFGAKCDGSTDDTTALQAAINAVLAVGGELDFPDSTCVITSALTIPSSGQYWMMRGLGRSATIQQKTNNTQIFIFGYLTHDWRVSSLTLTWANAQSSSNTSAVAFWFTGNSVSIFDWEADHLIFSNGFRGFSDDGTTSPSVWGNHIHHITYQGTMTGALYNTTPAISVGQPRTSIDHIYVTATDIAATEPIITLSAVDSFDIDNYEVNGDSNGEQILSLIAGSSGHIGTMRLETGTFNAGNNAYIVSLSNAALQLDEMYVTGLTLPSSDGNVTVLNVSNSILNVSIVNLGGATLNGNNLYVFNGAPGTYGSSNTPGAINVGQIIGLQGTAGYYLTPVSPSATANHIQVFSWQLPVVVPVGDTNYSWTAGESPQTLEFSTTLTADRTVTINDADTGNDSNLYSGYGPHVVRDAATPGAHNLFIKNSSGTTIATLPGNGVVNASWYRFGWEIGVNPLVSPTFSGTATFTGQIVTSYGTPTIASGACGATTNGSIASGGTNQSGQVQIGSATTTTCTISFSTTLSAAPLACTLTPANAAAAATGTTVARVSSISTSAWVISGSALANANYYYTCI